MDKCCLMMGRVGWITHKSYNNLMEVLNVTAEENYIVHEYRTYKIVKLKILTKVGYRTKQSDEPRDPR